MKREGGDVQEKLGLKRSVAWIELNAKTKYEKVERNEKIL